VRILWLIPVLLLTLAGVADAATNQLDWTDNSTNEAAFHVERAAAACGGAGVFAEIATVGQNVTTYLDPTVAEETPYCYRVRARNAAGFSGYTNEAGRTPPGETPPSAPSGLTVR
jgi:hypothetical protein